MVISIYGADASIQQTEPHMPSVILRISGEAANWHGAPALQQTLHGGPISSAPLRIHDGQNNFQRNLLYGQGGIINFDIRRHLCSGKDRSQLQPQYNVKATDAAVKVELCWSIFRQIIPKRYAVDDVEAASDRGMA